MANSRPLDILIDLARDHADEAARQLQQLTAARRSAENKLSMLMEYRQDYAQRLQVATQGGLTATNYHNFRQFIATLDEAISQQNKAVAQIDLKIERGRDHWNEEKRKLNSFETLQSRQARQQALRENRQEQRFNDEISANLFRRTCNSH